MSATPNPSTRSTAPSGAGQYDSPLSATRGGALQRARLTRRGLAGLGIAALVGAAGCAKGATSASTSPSAGLDAAGGSTPTPSAVATPFAATVTSAHGTTAMLPTDSLQVKASSGTVTAVTVTDAKGKQVAGTLSGTTWTPTRNLLPEASYTATITGTDSTGATQSLKRTFSTLKTNIAGYDILYDGFEVGVGMPASIQFVSSVETKAMRAEVEKHVHITVTPAQEGSWGWLDDRQLMWRPKTFFKPGTKVTITTDFAGLQTGSNKWLGRDDEGGFTVGDARILYTDVPNHTMRVTQNGKTIRTIPVTNGKSGYTTRSGTKVIIERDRKVKMDSSTVDIPAGSADSYSLEVSYAERLTWTGEFIHAAPWSVGSQGYANVSHGCTGVSTANGEWLFNFLRAGDVDIVTGTSRIMKPTEGIGVWQYSYAQWKKQSALS